jgi:hypothetical protein
MGPLAQSSHSMAHAYIASTDLINRIASGTYTGEHFDEWLHTHTTASKRYVYPMFLYIQTSDTPCTASQSHWITNLISLANAAKISEYPGS